VGLIGVVEDVALLQLVGGAGVLGGGTQRLEISTTCTNVPAEAKKSPCVEKSAL
jgi:hypothetical protein